MRVTFLGGADEVGASSTLVEIGGRRLLVDAGIRPSPKARWGLAGDQAPDLAQIDRAGGIDAVLVTHAHTDHTGALELVVGRYNCPVYATPITVALTRVLHADSRRIMQTRLDEEGDLPLFDDVAVDKLLAAFVLVPFNTRVAVGGGIAATFFPAGHIAGAAMIGLESDEGRLLISGDVSVSPQRTVDGLRPPAFQPDALILESTYGGRLHANRAVEERRLVEAVARVTGQGGKVLIPAFALGRAQEILLILSEFRKRGEALPPVWADGMVRAICQAYAQFPDALPLALQERGAQFFDAHTHPVERADQRAGLIGQPEPAILVSSSGMLAGGPSVQYARALAGSPQHSILLTGYQDEESPGRRLQELASRGTGTIRLGKETVDVHCHVSSYSLSAHADEGQLVSLVETLDPAEVLLVHGDEQARESLGRALAERKRVVTLPRTGQSIQFQFRAPITFRRSSRLGQGRPLDLAALWESVAGPAGGGYFTLEDLALAWWGDERQADDLAAELERDGLYFAPDALRTGWYRAHTRAQLDLMRERREALAGLPDPAGQVVLLREESGSFRAACCERVSASALYLVGDASPRWPEQVVDVIGPCPPGMEQAVIEAMAADLAPQALLSPGAQRPLDEIVALLPDPTMPVVALKAAVALALVRAGAERTESGYGWPLARPGLGAEPMEPNQALAHVRAQFPPEARLRRCGYRLDQRAIVLSFDFPDAAQAQFAPILARLPAETGWAVELDPEANQAALTELARQVLGERLIKGPAIHRADKRVAVAAAAQPGESFDKAAERFRQASGYELSITVAARPAGPPASAPTSAAPGARVEINAAYAVIRQALAGSTLYRTSLTGDTILLSFISQQVGERYRAEIESLARQVGWPLAINPQPNQGAILEAARKIMASTGWSVLKGPGIHVDRGEVEARLAAMPDELARQQAEADFESQTGYRLVLSAAAAPLAAAPQAAPSEVVEIPIGLIRLGRMHQGMALSQDKIDKAVERARRLGKISPPIQVRRLRDSYLLLDGLYRLEAARALGLERIPATVET